jgi:hypothetical protein
MCGREAPFLLPHGSGADLLRLAVLRLDSSLSDIFFKPRNFITNAGSVLYISRSATFMTKPSQRGRRGASHILGNRVWDPLVRVRNNCLEFGRR